MSPTTQDLQAILGRQGLLTVLTGGRGKEPEPGECMEWLRNLATIRVPIIILDAKTAYGCIRYLVRPVDGQGTAWVDSGRVELGTTTTAKAILKEQNSLRCPLP